MEIILAIIAFIIAFIIRISLGIESFFLTFIIWLVIAGIEFALVVAISSKLEKPEDKITYITFSKEDESATLYHRNPRSIWNLKVVPVHDFYYKHHQAELIYTSVSGGGVTVGGVDVIPASQTVHSGKNTGKCRFEAELYDGKKFTVKEIHLSDELVVEAQNNPFIKKYLVGNKIVLSVKKTKEIEKGEENYKNALLWRMPNAEEIFKREVYFPSLLTMEEGQNILKWITGGLNPANNSAETSRQCNPDERKCECCGQIQSASNSICVNCGEIFV